MDIHIYIYIIFPLFSFVNIGPMESATHVYAWGPQADYICALLVLIRFVGDRASAGDRNHRLYVLAVARIYIYAYIYMCV